MELSPRRYLITPEADLALERWVIAALTGFPQSFPTVGSVSPEQLLRYAEFHGVVGLLYVRMASAPPSYLPGPAWISALEAAARFQAARELLLRQQLGEVLTVARQRGLRPLLLKGAALAYTLYAEPSQRGRVDTDLLIAVEDKAAMRAVLDDLGYVGDLIAADHWATSERSFTKKVAADLVCQLDIHWRISNSPIFWNRELEYERLLEGAQAVSSLHHEALCPDIATLLVHACLHRAGHATSPMRLGGEALAAENRLIWLYDIHLLSTAMNESAWTRFLTPVTRIGLRRICHAAFQAAADRFGTAIPPRVSNELGRRCDEPASEFLAGTWWRIKRLEFLALPSTAARVGWVREHLLPNRAYMRDRFAADSRAPLFMLYLRRLLLSRRAH